MATEPTARVIFEPEGQQVTVPVGTTLLDAAHAAGVRIDAPCGGVGRCGACRVVASGELSPLTADEGDVLGGAGVAAGKRLACRARALGAVTVTVRSKRTREPRIVTDSAAPAVAVEPPAARGITGEGALLGAAVDIGTTTVAVALVDLSNGDVLAHAAALSAQAPFGADVMTRVTAAVAGKAGRLQEIIALQVQGLVLTAAGQVGAAGTSLADIVAVGNTAMTSLLLGRDVAPLAGAPYIEHTAWADVTADELGMAELGRCPIHVLPGVSAFIGPDITAGLVATSVPERGHPTLFIDLGTNGEIVLATGGRVLAASTAAGPALEGAAIACGMRAETGAIERVALDGDSLSLGVIGDAAPAGICGSGLLDLTAALLDAGVLDGSGAFAAELSRGLGARLTERGGVRVFVVDEASDIVLSQKDVRQLQLAVGAVRTGIDLLLAEAGVRAGDIAEVVVAGGFGLHVSAYALARLGLIPAEWADRVSFAGNTALAGARAALVSSAMRERARKIARGVTAVDLASHPEFQRRFIAALRFPER
ncbi:MAG: DUF4445 domain-containing protein [Coriobacteriia bacterium]|nr:DUF4445 domain-containing protein [Coriobacteriia bacterium]